MNINNTLSKFFRDTPIVFCRDGKTNERLKADIITFLKVKESNFDSKFQQAIKQSRQLIKCHGKEPLYHHIDELYEVEEANRVLTEKRDKRDHVIHALNTFLLGIYINNKYLGNGVDMFQWKVAALFHDIAYPLEIAQEIIARYFKIISEIKEKLDVETYTATLNLIPKDIDKLTHNKSAFDLIQRRVYEWGLDVNVKKRYDDMIKEDFEKPQKTSENTTKVYKEETITRSKSKSSKDNKLCHGILSSLTVLYLIDLMYQKNNPLRDNRSHNGWKQKNFEKDIVSACSAIFLHNLGDDAFGNIDKTKAQLAYLLKLSDGLQEWDRPKKKMSEGDSPENYDIQGEQNKLIFKVSNQGIKDQIESNIKCLKDNSISIKII